MRGFIRRRFAVAFCVALASWGNVARGEQSLDWDPARTWVFAVGLIEWEREDLWAPFPAAMVDRRDEQLVDYFRDAGVDEDRINYVQDSDATKANVQEAFIEMLDETEEGDLLVFYFCGHGHRDSETGGTWFATYDAGDENSSGWSVRRIFSTIEAHFNGDRVLLLADCCHSGALYDEARRRGPDSDISYAVLTSSYAHNLSTGNWTFSDCVLAGLRGEGQCDLNGDEAVDLQEVARYSELELAFVEGQKSMFHAAKEFPRRAVLAEVEEPAEPRVGQRLEVEHKGKWYRAKATDADGDQLYVHYTGFEDSWDEWVGPERVRPYHPAQYAEGDKVEVCWEADDQWYPATVVRGWYGLHRVRYDGFDASSDEWVGPARIRLRTE